MAVGDDFTIGQGHSYRNFNPVEIAEIADNPDLSKLEAQEELQGVFAFIESGRLRDFCESTFAFFIRLDRDEKRLFTRRNPDLVQWVSLWGMSQEATDPLAEWWETGMENLADDRSEAVDPPEFPAPETTDYEDLLKSMRRRRQSYRNWAPAEFERIMERGKTPITKGVARQLELYTPEFIEDMQDSGWPFDEDTKNISRALLEKRVESGRFEPALDDGSDFFHPLDIDERRLFAARNPGILRWISVWGESNHQIHGEEQLRVEFRL